MKNKKQKGAALVLAIISMSIIGIEMHVLSRGANAMLTYSDRAYLDACKRNLITSGLAWAKRNIRNNNTDNFETNIELDISDLKIKDSSLAIFITTPANEEPQAKINVSCSRNRRTLKSDKKYQISL